MEEFPVIVVTGLSGSGKSTALKVFEDLGFFTVDGLPVQLATRMANIFQDAALPYAGLALGMDIRQPDFLKEYERALDELRDNGFIAHVVFLEAKDSILMQRYATTRRPHPLEKEGLGLERALASERNLLRHLRKQADLVLDTSVYSIHDLRRTIQSKWQALRQQPSRALRIHLITFGFKYGMPAEADMVFDLRFLPNPYFIPELRPLSGLNAPIAEYVLQSEPGKTFLGHLTSFLSYVLEQYEAEGRFRLTIAIGCTGGRHRSVAVAEAIAKSLTEEEYTVSLEHRHLELG